MGGLQREADRQPLTGHTSYVLGLAFSPDGKTIASASRDGTVRLWDPASGKQLGVLEGVAFLPPHGTPVAFVGIVTSLIASLLAAQIARLRARVRFRRGQHAEA